jgi:hypothetical protein
LRGHTAGAVVSARGLIGRSPTPIQFEQLPLHQRSAKRVVTVHSSVLDVAAGGEISRRIAIKKKAAKSNGRPAGKVREVFERVSKLPRRQQEHIVNWVSAYVSHYEQTSQT